ncbi:MAG: TolC family protein [Paludibacter sp.]|nr:TolC family protein [Paludibacter sp.]
MKIYKTIVFILILLSLEHIAAQVQIHDSLLYYMNIAAKYNPGLLAKTDEYKAALLRVPQVSSLPDPELNMSVFLTPMEVVSGKQVADFELMQMFPWFGTLKYAKDEMSLMAKASYESLKDARLQLFYEVQNSWYDLYRTRRQLALTGNNIDLLKTIEQLALIKYKTSSSGISTPAPVIKQEPKTATQNTGNMSNMSGNTVPGGGSMTASGMSGSPMNISTSGLPAIYRLQMERNEPENELSILMENEKAQKARFNALLNRPATAQVFVPDTLEIDSIDISLIEHPDDNLFLNQPMLEMLRYESQSLTAKGKMVDRMGYPMLGVGLGYSVIGKSETSSPMMNGMDMVMPMLKVSIPIYRKKYKAIKSETEMLRSATQNNLKETQNQILTAYFEARQRYENARRQISLYSEQVALLQKILTLSMKDFSISGNGLSELLRTRQELFDYELKQEEAVAELNTSIAYLRRLTAYQYASIINNNK